MAGAVWHFAIPGGATISVLPIKSGKREVKGMPAKSKAQQRLMGADLARKREGKKTRTGMTEEQLKEFAGTPRRGLPARKKKK